MRDQLPRLAGDEPVRLCVVGLAIGRPARNRLELVGRHLVVGGHHARDVHAVRDRLLVARDDAAPTPRFCSCRSSSPRGSARGATSAVPSRDARRRRRSRRRGRACRRASPEQLLLVERGNDDCDGLPSSMGQAAQALRACGRDRSQSSATIIPSRSPMKAPTMTSVVRLAGRLVFTAIADDVMRRRLDVPARAKDPRRRVEAVELERQLPRLGEVELRVDVRERDELLRELRLLSATICACEARAVVIRRSTIAS